MPGQRPLLLADNALGSGTRETYDDDNDNYDGTSNRPGNAIKVEIELTPSLAVWFNSSHVFTSFICSVFKTMLI